jgi:hypothetical protein
MRLSKKPYLHTLYKKYANDYEAERFFDDLTLVKALDRSFKMVSSGGRVSGLIKMQHPQGFIPNSVSGYIDAAAGHVRNKHIAERTTQLYSRGSTEMDPPMRTQGVDRFVMDVVVTTTI